MPDSKAVSTSDITSGVIFPLMNWTTSCRSASCSGVNPNSMVYLLDVRLGMRKVWRAMLAAVRWIHLSAYAVRQWLGVSTCHFRVHGQWCQEQCAGAAGSTIGALEWSRNRRLHVIPKRSIAD